MRMKEPLTEDGRQFKCCFCCHVRVGTALLGVFHVVINLLALAFTAASLLSSNSDILKDDLKTGITFNVDSNGSTTDNMYWTNQFSPRDGCLMFAFILVMFVMSMMMVYGSVRSRPGHLIPFFCLQVFDFCLHSLSVVSYMTYAPNIKLWLIDQGLADSPMFERLMTMDEQWLQIWFLLFWLLILTAKAYLINMVWLCYRYLQLRNINRSVVREYTVDPDTEMLLPPKYEEAMKMSPVGAPPPPYTA